MTVLLCERYYATTAPDLFNGEQLFILSRKGGTLLVLDNFLYRSNFKRFGKQSNKFYWECVHNRSLKCRSRLKTIGDNLIMTNAIHNHPPDTQRIRTAKNSGNLLIIKKISEIIPKLDYEEEY